MCVCIACTQARFGSQPNIPQHSKTCRYMLLRKIEGPMGTGPLDDTDWRTFPSSRAIEAGSKVCLSPVIVTAMATLRPVTPYYARPQSATHCCHRVQVARSSSGRKTFPRRRRLTAGWLAWDLAAAPPASSPQNVSKISAMENVRPGTPTHAIMPPKRRIWC
jgi:hypothetical protein